MNTKKRERPAEVSASTGPNCPKTQPSSKENELVKSTQMVTAAPAAAKNRVTRKTLVREVFALWLAGDTAILGECDKFYKAWKVTPEALAITARTASSS